MTYLNAIEAERFASKTEWSGKCLLWTGYRNPDGYGKVTVRRTLWSAHRLAYVEAWGAIPEGMVVRHKCDTPACVNPSHLELGSEAENARDKAVRKRVPTKVSDDQVRRIRSDQRTMREIAADFGISPSAACLIKSGQRRQHVGG